MRIALKVDVDTYRGSMQGIPALLELFRRYEVTATFLFSLGPDHTGRAIRRIFRPGFLSKVSRTSVVEHYGLKTLMYGVLLPGPHIGKKAGSILREVHQLGHEVGIHCYDHIRWQDFVRNKNRRWTQREFQRAADSFEQVFGFKAQTHGAAGWQLNPWLLELEQAAGFRYASDVRGYRPFYPTLAGMRSSCVQLPTTLPTLDELIGCNGITDDNVHETVFEASRQTLPAGHVYTLHAELEGMKLLPVMERLLQAWQQAGDEIVTLERLYQGLDLDKLPHQAIEMKEIDGRSGQLAVQQGYAQV